MSTLLDLLKCGCSEIRLTADLMADLVKLIETARDVERTERAYWDMPPSRNPERYAKAHEDAKKRLYAALARITQGLHP